MQSKKKTIMIFDVEKAILLKTLVGKESCLLVLRNSLFIRRMETIFYMSVIECTLIRIMISCTSCSRYSSYYYSDVIYSSNNHSNVPIKFEVVLSLIRRFKDYIVNIIAVK